MMSERLVSFISFTNSGGKELSYQYLSPALTLHSEWLMIAAPSSPTYPPVTESYAINPINESTRLMSLQQALSFYEASRLEVIYSNWVQGLSPKNLRNVLKSGRPWSLPLWMLSEAKSRSMVLFFGRVTRKFLSSSLILIVLFFMIFSDSPFSNSPISSQVWILFGFPVPSLTGIYSVTYPASFFFSIKSGIVKCPKRNAAVEKMLVIEGSISGSQPRYGLKECIGPSSFGKQSSYVILFIRAVTQFLQKMQRFSSVKTLNVESIYSQSRLCSRTKRVLRAMRTIFSLTRASPETKSPFILFRSPYSFSLILPDWNVLNLLADALLLPQICSPSNHEFSKFICCRAPFQLNCSLEYIERVNAKVSFPLYWGSKCGSPLGIGIGHCSASGPS